MSAQKGIWIKLEVNPTDIATNGIPEVGNTIRIDFNDKYSPATGLAKLIETDSRLDELYECPSYGADYIFSANFV